MLKPKKKLTKRELKQDPILTSIGQAKTFYELNKKYISYATVALAVAILALFAYLNNRRQNDEKAATELGRVYKIYDAGVNDKAQYTIAINGVRERGIMGLKEIVDNYGSTSSGEMARLYLANAYYNLGQYDEAMKNYDKFSSSDNLLNASATAGIAGCYEARNDMADAARRYEEAASISGASASVTAEYVNDAARDYGLAGQKEKAVELFKRLKKEFPTSTYARDADRYITQFSI